jgi:hypothetical protein
MDRSCSPTSQNLEEQPISSAVMIKFFRACVKSSLLYNSVTSTLTDTLSRKLDYKWSNYVPNSILNNGLKFASIGLLEKQSNFVSLGTVFEASNLSATYFYEITPN